MVAYKLVRVRKNGSLASLFINARDTLKVGEWMEAELHPTKGFATRFGWHCCFKPIAPHLSERGRVWVECEVEGTTVYDRPESQGGAWILANRMRITRVLTQTEVEEIRVGL